MSEPDIILPAAASADAGAAPHARPGLTHAEWMLIIATVIWGSSFALAKGSGEAINGAAGEGHHVIGPLMTLALRFTFGAIAWIALVPAARVGWTRASFARGGTLGALLATGLILQHVALDRTTEAVAAFLTSLTVIFVPLILWIVMRQKLAAAAWIGVAIAFPGVWLMSGADRTGIRLGVGEWLGLACAVVFAFHLPLINAFAKHETPYRMAAAQFATVAAFCWLGTGVCMLGVDRFDWHVLITRDVWLNVLLLVAFPTLLSFGLVNVYQPKVEPVRSVLVYLLEPIFAATFAWIWVGRTMTRGMILGGALILAANAVVELWPVLRRKSATVRRAD